VARLLARVARWSLPAALLVATLVAAVGLGSLLFADPATPPAAPPVALNLSSAPALPVPDDSATLTPQQLPVAAAPAGCPAEPQPACLRAEKAAIQASCCR
jgi:hypothetical protein